MPRLRRRGLLPPLCARTAPFGVGGGVFAFGAAAAGRVEAAPCGFPPATASTAGGPFGPTLAATAAGFAAAALPASAGAGWPGRGGCGFDLNHAGGGLTRRVSGAASAVDVGALVGGLLGWAGGDLTGGPLDRAGGALAGGPPPPKPGGGALGGRLCGGSPCSRVGGGCLNGIAWACGAWFERASSPATAGTVLNAAQALAWIVSATSSC